MIVLTTISLSLAPAFSATLHDAANDSSRVTLSQVQGILKTFHDKDLYMPSSKKEKSVFAVYFSDSLSSLMNFDRVHATHFAYEGALSYLQNYENQIFFKVEDDPIFRYLLDTLPERLKDQNLSGLFLALEKSSDTAIIHFLDATPSPQFNIESNVDILKFLMVHQDDIQETLKPSAVEHVFNVYLRYLENMKASNIPGSRVAAENQITSLSDRAIKIFTKMKQPLIVKFYENRFHDSQNTINSDFEAAAAKSMAINQIRRNYTSLEQLHDMISSHQAGTLDVYLDSTMFKVQKVSTNRVRDQANVYSLRKMPAQTLYQITNISPHATSHESLMKLVDILLNKERVDGLIFEDYSHVPHELEQGDYERSRQGEKIIIRSAQTPSMCSGLFK